MKQQKLFHLVLSAMLIVCTTGCYDKDEIKDAEKYLFKDIQYSFEEGDGFSTYDVELLPFIMENNLNNSITTTNSPFEDTWQETTFQSNDPEAFVWMGEEDVFVNTPYMFGDELLLSGATIKYGSETTVPIWWISGSSTEATGPSCVTLPIRTPTMTMTMTTPSHGPKPYLSSSVEGDLWLREYVTALP